jgi:adenine-specific DNA-methyltransferase
LVVNAPPLYIQEKVHPKVLIDDLARETGQREHAAGEKPIDLFADFNGLPHGVDRTEFYRHDQNWTNRMILGDSLQVMASLGEREGLRGKVQCIYIDPPYGIKFNSNFQWSTTSRDVKDGNAAHITREPEQVKAFRDTWRDDIHSYLTYLRDRLTVARDLLTESGSIFVQIGDENVHLVRSLLDEVFGADRFHAQITYRKTSPLGTDGLGGVTDYVLSYAKSEHAKFRPLFEEKEAGGEGRYSWIQLADGSARRMSREERSGASPLPGHARAFVPDKATAAGLTPSCVFEIRHAGKSYWPHPNSSWSSNPQGMRHEARPDGTTCHGSRWQPGLHPVPRRLPTQGVVQPLGRHDHGRLQRPEGLRRADSHQGHPKVHPDDDGPR